jgi:hypothetical protein
MPKSSKTSPTPTREVDVGDPQTMPPYGYINEEWMYDVRTRRVPVGFRIGGKPVLSEADYTKWLEATVADIAEFLWPQYDQATRAWVGQASKNAWALTIADLDLMHEKLQPMLVARAPSRDKSVQDTHKALFLVEDIDKSRTTYPKYENGLPADQILAAQEQMRIGLGDFGPAPLRFKEYFQRPRPYQIAFMRGRPFAYEWGKSAVTPALISGHSIQGLIQGCRAYIGSMLKLELVAGAVDSLQQWCIDVGDRRVFAGVHYPSDNLASWYVALKLCDHYMFGELNSQAKDFIKDAIRKSEVFKAMQAHVSANPKSSPYKLPLDRLGVKPA